MFYQTGLLYSMPGKDEGRGDRGVRKIFYNAIMKNEYFLFKKSKIINYFSHYIIAYSNTQQ